MYLTPVAAPESEPVQESQAMEHLNETNDDRAIYVGGLIGAARGMAENYTGRAIMRQTWKYTSNAFCDIVRLPLPPLVSVTSIKYYDGGNVLQTMNASDFYVFADAGIGCVSPVESWPSTYTRPDAVQITFLCGYLVCPHQIQQAILLTIGELYNNREETIIGKSISKLPLTSERLLAPYRVYL